MNKKLNLLGFIALIAFVFVGCDKANELPKYEPGIASNLTASTNTISSVAADSSKTAVTLNWTSPQYSVDTNSYKFIIQIDSTGKNFKSPVEKTVTGAKNLSFTSSDLNSVLATLGLQQNQLSSIDVRLISSYSNNNEQFKSNTITLKVTPYNVPVALTMSPSSALTLTIANAANTALTFNYSPTQYGNYPVTYALQIDKATGDFSTPQIYNFNSGLSGTISVSDLNTAALNLGFAPNAAANLKYRIVATIATNPTNKVYSNLLTNTVTTYEPFLYLWVPGDYQSWTPATAPQLGAALPNLNDFEGYVNVGNGGSYEFKINNAPDWNHTSYGGTATKLSTSGNNLMWPTGGGTYRVQANTSTLAWSATKVTWSIIGSATPGGWGSDTPLTYDAANKVWKIVGVRLTGGDELKFRANNDWGTNFGGDLNNLSYGGSNIKIPTTGAYTIILNLNSPRKYKATIQ